MTKNEEKNKKRREANLRKIAKENVSDVNFLLFLLDEARAIIKDYEFVIQDKRRLAREIDVALHGEENAAKQASLCDLISPAKNSEPNVSELSAENKTLSSEIDKLKQKAAKSKK